MAAFAHIMTLPGIGCTTENGEGSRMRRLVLIVVAVGLLAGILPGRAQAAGPEVKAKSAVLMDVHTGTVLC